MDQAASREFVSRAKSIRSISETLEQRVLLSGSGVDLLGNSPAVFVQNRGQWDDKSVDYALQSTAANVLMTDQGPIYQVFDQSSNGTKTGEEFYANFLGSNTVTPTGLDQSSAQFNYYLDGNSLTNVPGYEKIVYNNLYNGINLVTAGKASSIKYEFDVAPGADPNQVQVSYHGVEGLSIDHLGRLHIETQDGDLIDAAPVVYQNIDGKQVQIKSEFKLLGNNTYTFQLDGAYDKTQELILDPNLTWSTFLGGSADDNGNGIAADATGNSYITGETASADFPTTNGFDTILAGTDAFITKLDPAGALLWSTYLGGSGTDIGNAIALDRANNVYVTGETTSTNFPHTGGFDTTLNGFADAFVTKITTNGALSWSTYLGGSSTDSGTGIGVDTNGIVYVAGSTSSSDFPTAGGFDASLGGSQDGFVTAINTNVTIKWSSYLGGNDVDTINGLSVSAAGVVGVVGTTSSTTGLATTGAFDTTFGGVQDAFAASINGPAGTLNWATYFGGTKSDSGSAVVVDTGGNIDITGSTLSPAADFTTAPINNSTLGAFQEAFVAQFTNSATGTLGFWTYVGVGNVTLPAGQVGGAATGLGITDDNNGNLYLVGATAAQNGLPGIANGFDSVYGGGADDGFITILTTTGTIQSTSYLGGTQTDEILGVAASAIGDVFVTGFTQSNDFPAFNAFDTTFNGSSDAFVARISPAGGVTTPNTPTNLIAIPISFSEIDLSWSDRSRDQLGFQIFRRTIDGTYSMIGTVGAGILTFKDTTVSPNTTYVYRVLAFSVSGNSPFSNAAKATTPSGALVAPSDLTATAISSSQIDLKWKDNSNNETGFEVWRRALADIAFALIATTGRNASSFVDQSGLLPSTQYLYEVRAINTVTQSLFSNVASAITKSASFIVAPSGLVATRLDDGDVELTWNDNSNNETGFTIERAVTGSSSFSVIDTTQAGITEFIDTDADPSTVFTYRVQAFNGSATSDFSNLATTDLATALGAPQRFEAQALSPTSIALTWVNHATIATDLILERAFGTSNDFSEIRTLNPATTGFTDKNLIPNAQYRYRIRATDGTNFSPYSQIAAATTLQTFQTIPLTPSHLNGEALKTTEIELFWRDNANNETNYVVERATSIDGPFAIIDTLAANTTAFIDKGLTPGTTYFYRVRARLGTIRSFPSNIAQIKTLGKKPAAPAVAFSNTPIGSAADKRLVLDVMD